ncbi:MAG TPA: CRISPR-associated protein Csx19 [Candidatus Competibacter sp.]|nr:hypothetical protein [Candidatus Competibacteraceae bacterium]HRC72972.1 CRISPR-associated protein Csx19 [Candidatus Competibacter sp.]
MSKVHLENRYLQFEPTELTGADLRAALTTAWQRPTGWLFGQTFGGVIWGRLRDGELDLTTNASIGVAALLRHDTLLNLRLFDAERELRAWRVDAGLEARLVSEGAAGEEYAAWQEQSYGLRLSELGRLRARHYLAMESETGLLRVAEHRLLALEP